MQFGFTLKPDHSIDRTLALARQAEAAGFSHGWLFDSHVLWRDPYPLLTLIAQASRDKDEVLTADLDLDQIAEVRKTWQFFRDRRPDMYESLVRA